MQTQATPAKTAGQWRTDFLVDYHGEGQPPCGLQKCPPPKPGTWHMIEGWNNTYTCLRTLSDSENSIYCEFADTENFVEFYDIAADPWQLHNVAKQLAPVLRDRLKERLQELRACAGTTCRAL